MGTGRGEVEAWIQSVLLLPRFPLPSISPSIDANTILPPLLFQCPYFLSFLLFTSCNILHSPLTPICSLTHSFVLLSVHLTLKILLHSHISARRKLRKYGHWKRRGGSMVLASIEGEIEGRRTDWMSNILEWEGGVEHAHSRAWNRMSTARPGL